MGRTLRETLVVVLAACGRLAPTPFRPKIEVDRLNLERAELDAALDHLRLGGFVEIADWVVGEGQGYKLTPAGELALEKPELLDRPDAPALKALQAETSEPTDPGELFRRRLMHPPRPWVTPTLIGLNIMVFAAGLLLESTRGIVLRRAGAIQPFVFFVHDEWWRLASYMFLHANLIHLTMNMMALFSLGSLLETRWGWPRFAAVYFGSGLLAGCAALLFNEPGVATVGASGAIAGVLTSVAVWTWMYSGYLSREFAQAQIRAVSLNLVLMLAISLMPNISMACHAGGAIGGAVLSIPLAWLGADSRHRHRTLAVLAFIAIAGLAVGALWSMAAPNFAGERGLEDVRRGGQSIQRIFADDAEPLLREGVDGLPPGRLAELRSRFRVAEATSDRLATVIRKLPLDEFNLPRGPLAEQFAKRRDFFRGMLDLLDHPAAWPQPRRDALFRDWLDNE